MTCPPCTLDCNQGRNCPARNNNEVIEMARQASRSSESRLLGCGIDDLVAFAKLVAAKEREACAKVCDELFADVPPYSAPDCAAAIRARG